MSARWLLLAAILASGPQAFTADLCQEFLSPPDSAAGTALREVARTLSKRAHSLAGRSLGLTPSPGSTTDVSR